MSTLDTLCRVHRRVCQVVGPMSLVIVRRRVRPDVLRWWVSELRGAAADLDKLITEGRENERATIYGVHDGT